MKKNIKKIPIISQLAKLIFQKWRATKAKVSFRGSKKYWIERYYIGKNSGDGSYGKFAEFKAEILNSFVSKENIKTIIEYGCGDGNQLKLAKYPSYLGFDVSPEAIRLCKEQFAHDNTKTFKLMSQYAGETAELTLSLDVIYHLIEDEVFNEYMHRLFNSAEKFVIIYSSNTDKNQSNQPNHIKHRQFSKWVEQMKPEWKLRQHIPNKYPFKGDTKNGSFSDFYIYTKTLE